MDVPAPFYSVISSLHSWLTTPIRCMYFCTYGLSNEYDWIFDTFIITIFIVIQRHPRGNANASHGEATHSLKSPAAAASPRLTRCPARRHEPPRWGRISPQSQSHLLKGRKCQHDPHCQARRQSYKKVGAPLLHMYHGAIFKGIYPRHENCLIRLQK